MEEARLARDRLDVVAWAEVAATSRLEERVAGDVERARCRLEDIERRDRDATFRLERADEELVRRTQSVAVTKTKLHADV